MRPRAKHEARAVPFRGESRRGITTKSSVQRERPIRQEGVGASGNVNSDYPRELRSVLIKDQEPECRHKVRLWFLDNHIKSMRPVAPTSDPYILLAALWCHHQSTFFGRPEV